MEQITVDSFKKNIKILNVNIISSAFIGYDIIIHISDNNLKYFKSKWITYSVIGIEDCEHLKKLIDYAIKDYIENKYRKKLEQSTINFLLEEYRKSEGV